MAGEKERAEEGYIRQRRSLKGELLPHTRNRGVGLQESFGTRET